MKLRLALILTALTLALALPYLLLWNRNAPGLSHPPTNTVNPTDGSKIDFAAANHCLESHAQEILSAAHQLSRTMDLRRFVVHPSVDFAQRAFDSNELAARQLDLVVICNSQLTPMLATAYDRIHQSATPVDPEIKLSLSNHPIFNHLHELPVAVLKTFRGTMLLAYVEIQSSERPQVAGYLIVGRILTPAQLHGAHLQAVNDRPPSNSPLWPDIFGHPAFTLN